MQALCVAEHRVSQRAFCDAVRGVYSENYQSLSRVVLTCTGFVSTCKKIFSPNGSKFRRLSVDLVRACSYFYPKMSTAVDITEADPDGIKTCPGCSGEFPNWKKFTYFSQSLPGDKDLTAKELRKALSTRPGKLFCPSCVAYQNCKKQICECEL